ncbi:putative ABC transport system permease protein [Aeromonas sp. RU39B]|uniref:ABC transporter permease n=1 Tax=Aeromonas sp. RU39B TaxID=1907416 RepID=UPI0009551E43|nr:ABC transporter permease [Aeromonas sp. RU39B]SIQ62930.1 putative ABC transport system permease protein [Aeromonas sp. RU39B]
MLKLALSSLWARRLTATLTMLAVAISVTLLLGVERVRTQARESFASTVSGTDLIVGARSGQVNLLLYSVFRLGNPTNNVGWDAYQEIAKLRGIAWTIPLSLGDSHKGFRVLGTSGDYFKYLRYGRNQPLQLSEGRPFTTPFEAVLGAEVAKKLRYRLGQSIVIAHGAGNTSFSLHDNLPFKVVGILAPTGTPVDRTVHVPLAGIEAIHLGWDSGRHSKSVTAEQALAQDLTPKTITAFMVGLNQRILAFQLQRTINTWLSEPLMAILPGAALQELWSLMSVAETALSVIAGFVVVAGLIGMLTTLLAGLNERRRELAILRSLGARPLHLFALLALEAAALTTAGLLVGVLLLYGAEALAMPWLLDRYGLQLMLSWPSERELWLLALVWISGLVIGLLPAWRAYRYSLSDGMSIRL